MPPVEDLPVHEKVKQKAGWKYGCNSSNERADGYYAPDRVYKPDGTFYIVQAYIKNAMSKKCRSFYLWSSDTGCADCQREKDTEYANRMASL